MKQQYKKQLYSTTSLTETDFWLDQYVYIDNLNKIAELTKTPNPYDVSFAQNVLNRISNEEINITI